MTTSTPSFDRPVDEPVDRQVDRQVDGRTDEGRVLVRFWASAKAAAGVAEEYVAVSGPVSLRTLADQLGCDRPALRRVLPVCSVLVGDRPTRTADADTVTVPPGAVVEFLPPFAGG